MQLSVPIQMQSDAFLLNDSAAAMTFDSPLGINGTSGLTITKQGTGATIVNAPINLIGPIVIEQGQMQFNGVVQTASPNVTVQTGGTIGGTGQVNRLVVVQNGGAIAPGADAIGNLTTGPPTINPNGVYVAEIDADPIGGTAADQAIVNGNVQISGANLTLVMTSAVFAPQTFTLINNDFAEPVFGQFAGVPDDTIVIQGLITFSVDYQFDALTNLPNTGNDVAITVLAIPEPTAAAMIAAFCCAAMTRRGRQNGAAIDPRLYEPNAVTHVSRLRRRADPF